MCGHGMRTFLKETKKKIYIRNYFAGGKRKLNVESRFIDWSQPAGKWREREYKRFLSQCARRTDEMKTGVCFHGSWFSCNIFFPSWIPFIVSRASSYYNFKVVASEKKDGKISLNALCADFFMNFSKVIWPFN